jgi:bla regulator protein blaR1
VRAIISSAMRSRRCTFLFPMLLAASAGLIAAAGSEPQTPSTAPALTYDVISIKPHVGDTNSGSMRQMPGGGVIAVNASTRTLITLGYSGLATEPIGLPPWATSDHYDVNATATLKEPSIDDRRAMMRALLAERFKFAAHLETRDQPAFDLVLARKDGRLGPGLVPSDIDCAKRAAEQRAAAEAARKAGTPPPPQLFTPPAAGSPVPPCSMRSTGNVVEGDFNMAGVASLVRPMVGRYVVDKTGLSRFYHLKLETAHMFQPPSPDTAPPAADDTPSIFAALPEQLGLKLEPSRAQVEVLVIDHIERPTDN